MSKIHIFIDGSWLFRVCAPKGPLADKTESPDKGFSLDFGKLNSVLLEHVHSKDSGCDGFGDRYFVTSYFQIPKDMEKWPGFRKEDFEKIKSNVHTRDFFSKLAVDSGYSRDAIYRPVLKPYILKKVIAKQYREKEVDTTVVALLTRSAIMHGSDYHMVLTGDSDMLPAIRIAYPAYTKNVIVVTSHPDELSAEHRQSSFSLSNFEFDFAPFYFQDHLEKITHGSNVYRCAACPRVFVRPSPLSRSSRPYCVSCSARRT